jgi:hypothetical protein
MSGKFRAVVVPTPKLSEDAFVSAAKTAAVETPTPEPGRLESYRAYLPPEQGGLGDPRLGEEVPAHLNARVMRQVNIEIPETLHWQLMRIVGTIPRMSARRFIIEAIAAKMNDTAGKIVPW